MPDIADYRPPCPQVHCTICGKQAEKAESTALHFGMPPTRYGILLIRVNCHGGQQDIACTFKWLESNRGKRIEAFAPVTHDYGLRDLVELDGFSLPTGIQQCQYQLEDRNEPAWPFQYVDQRFVRAIEREMALVETGSTIKPPTLEDSITVLDQLTKKLAALLRTSSSEAVGTSRVTVAAARVAVVAQKIFENFGTPAKRPEKWIDDALPNPARGTEWDRSLRDGAIDIKPEPIQIDNDPIRTSVFEAARKVTQRPIEITDKTTLRELGIEKDDRDELIFELISNRPYVVWPEQYDGHDWITVGDVIESARKHQLQHK